MHPLRPFGLQVTSAFPLPGLDPASVASPGSTHVTLCDPGEHELGWALDAAAERTLWAATIDGLPFSTALAADGEVRFRWADRATFSLSPDRAALRCAPSDPGAAAWRRVLLDSVLLTLVLLEGREALHASSVEIDGAVVAVVGLTGGGKSSLAAELIRRGGTFMGDDVLALERRDGRILGHPAPPVMNLDREREELIDGLGEELASIGDEAWVRVAGAATRPAPVDAVFLLDRTAMHAAAPLRRGAGALDLLPHSFYFDHTPERAGRRFALYSDLADSAAVWRLDATPTDPVEAIADRLDAVLTPSRMVTA